MKLKRLSNGVFRIGTTNWHLLRVYDENGKPMNLWDLAYDTGKDRYVGDVFPTQRAALKFFKDKDFGAKIDWRPR